MQWSCLIADLQQSVASHPPDDCPVLRGLTTVSLCRGTSSRRGELVSRRSTAWLFYRLMRRLVYKRLPQDAWGFPVGLEECLGRSENRCGKRIVSCGAWWRGLDTHKLRSPTNGVLVPLARASIPLAKCCPSHGLLRLRFPRCASHQHIYGTHRDAIWVDRSRPRRARTFVFIGIRSPAGLP
jgi:hypothetical protein